jgi:hypothetical protein
MNPPCGKSKLGLRATRIKPREDKSSKSGATRIQEELSSGGLPSFFSRTATKSGIRKEQKREELQMTLQQKYLQLKG